MRRMYGGGQIRGLSVLLPAVMLAVSAALPASAQRADAVVHVDIVSQPLRTALLAFARQTRLEIIATPELLNDKQAPAVKGVMHAGAALDALLSGSGLKARLDDGAYVLFRSQPRTPAVAPEVEVDVVTVVGFRASLLDNLASKRDANQVIDVITAEEFGQFPDQNVAEAIQRITVISMTRYNGEGDAISIRGLEPDLTRIQINGRSAYLTQDLDQPTVATSLSIFASDQFASIEVAKSPTARDDEGGVGGVVRLNTPRPFDVGNGALRADIQLRDSSISNGLDTRYAGMASTVSDDGRLGALIALSFDDRTRRVDQMRSLEGWAVAKPVQTQAAAAQTLRGKAYPVALDQQLRIGNQPRTNADITLQLQPDDTFQLLINADYASEDRRETISRVALNLGRNKSFLSGHADAQTDTIETLVVEDALLTLNNRGLNRDITSWGATLNPQWTFDDWSFSARADYSVGQEIGRDRRVRHRSSHDIGYSLVSDERAPAFDLGSVDLSDLGALTIDQNVLEYRVIRSSEAAGQADVSHKLGGPLDQVSAGFKFRQIDVDRHEGIANGSLAYTFADAASPFPLADFFNGAGGPDLLRVWPYVDANAFVDRYGPAEQDAKAAIDPLLGYSLTQQTLSGYAMAEFDVAHAGLNWRGNAGLRGVFSRFTGRGVRQAVDANGNAALSPLVTGSSDTEWLPSANLALTSDHAPDLVLRLAAARVMTRPRPAQLNPTITWSVTDMSLARGNPDLKPFVANQLDAGLEYYFGPRKEGLAAIALFHKDIENFVEPAVAKESYVVTPGQPAETVPVATFRNGGKGRVTGIELSVQTPFSVMTEALTGFGGAFNYTWLDAGRELSDGRSAAIPGNSQNTINATLYYDNGPFSARASYNFRDSYLEEEFGPSGNRIIVDDDGRLDVSFRYRMENGLRLSFDIANLTGEGRFSYADVKDRVISNQLEGRTVMVSLGYVLR